MKAFLLLIALAIPMAAQAQVQPEALQAPHRVDSIADDEAVRAAIVSLFDGMRASDSSAVRAVFHANATLQSIAPADKAYRIQSGEIDGFIAFVAGAPVGALDEGVSEIQVQVDAGLAHAWMTYAFYYQGQHSHCGVNSVQLIKNDGGDWQILNLVDTRRRDCE